MLEMDRIRNIRIYVRNKQKYNPATSSNNLQYVDIADFAGTTIGSIKEECRRNNAARIDDLYFNNEPLADDRSVAHYNLENGTILETTSNPFWVACMNIKIVEVERERDAHPHDKGVQKWTEKSYIRKRTILSVLLNSKSEFPRQPPHLPTVESLVEYLKTLGKKGTEMNPHYTQKDLQQFYNEYLTFDLDKADPIGSFITRQAVRLGFDGTGPQKVAGNVVKKPTARKSVAPRNTKPSSSTIPRSRKKSEKQEVMCEDCVSSRAEVYCPDCQGVGEREGVCLCMTCADKLHQGALKRNHNVRDIMAVPHAPKQYVPHPYRSPFAILIGMYSGLMETPPVLSMSEDDIKLRAQPFTDTDLQDKQTGRYVGGFDCLENTLMKKGLVQKEAADRHTFSLTAAGQQLGEQLYLFHGAVTIFRSANQVPDIPAPPINFQCGTRRLYLVVDDKERDLVRFRNLAKAHGIQTLIRSLPAGDYLWILSPPLASVHAEYDGNNKAAELVLPFLVERKSWNDYYNTWRTTRFKRQIDNMKASGLRNCFYLVEGSVKNLRFVSSGQQELLKAQLETLLCEERFYVNFTSSWSKSAQWLVWMSCLIAAAYKQGMFTDCKLTYPELHRNITRRSTRRETQKPGNTHVWFGQDLIAAVLSDYREDEVFSRTCDNNFGSLATSHRTPQLLVIEGLEAYNKQRSSLLNKCLESVINTSGQQMPDEVARLLKPEVESLLHYDVFSYWQLYIQVNYGVHVVRTEQPEDTARVQADFVRNKASSNGQTAPQTGTNQEHDSHGNNTQGPIGVRQTARPGQEMFHPANSGQCYEGDRAQGSSSNVTKTDRPEPELFYSTQGSSLGGEGPQGWSVRVPETQGSSLGGEGLQGWSVRVPETQGSSLGGDGPQGWSVRVPETPESEMFHSGNHNGDEEKKAVTGGDGPAGDLGMCYAPDSQTEEDMIRMAMEQSRQELESLPTATSSGSDITHTQLIGQVRSVHPSTSSGSRLRTSVTSQSHDGPNRSCVGQVLSKPEVISLNNSQEYVRENLNASPSSKAADEVISVEDSQEHCNEASISTATAVVISLEDSQEDDVQTEMTSFGHSACVSDGSVPDCLPSSGASVDDPVVLEDSQEMGDCIPLESDQVITLTDSLEGLPLPQNKMVKAEDQEKVEKTLRESQSQGQLLGVKSESNVCDNFSDMLTEEEQLKLALNQSLCESSCSNYGPVCDQNDYTSSNAYLAKTPIKRKLEIDYSPSAKVPRITCQINSPLEKLETDGCLKANLNTRGPLPIPLEELPQCEIYKYSAKTKTELMNEECVEQKFQNGSKAPMPKKQAPHSETDDHSTKEAITDEEIARQMQETFDREYKESMSESLTLSQPNRSLRSKRKEESVEAESESSPSQKTPKRCVRHLKSENPANKHQVLGQDEKSTSMNTQDMDTFRLLNEDTSETRLYSNGCLQSKTGSYQSDRRSTASEVSKATCQEEELLMLDVKTEGGSELMPENQRLHAMVDANDPLSNSANSEESSQSILGFIDNEEHKVHRYTESIHVKQEPTNPVPVDDEEFARQLQEQFNREAQPNKDSVTLKPKSLRNRTILKDSSVNSPVVQISGMQVKSEKVYAREIQIQGNRCHGENNQCVLSQDLEFARKLEMEESRNDSTRNQSITYDEECARKLQMQESRNDSKRYQRTSEDEEYAKRVQFEEHAINSFQSQNSQLTQDELFAQRIQEDQPKVPSLAEDEELARKMQMLENKNPSEKQRDYLSQDEDLARRMQNEESRRQPDPDLVNQDVEFARRIQREEDLLGKTVVGLDDKQKTGHTEGRSQGHEQSTKQNPLSGIRNNHMWNRSENMIVDQLSSYRESQRSKFANKTTPNKTQLDSNCPKMNSTVTAPFSSSQTPSRPLSSHQPRVPSATVSSPCQHPQRSRTPSKTCAVPVGKVVPYTAHTSSTFKGLGNRTSEENARVEVKVDLKKEEPIHTIDITESEESKAEGDECSPSKSLVVKNMRCGNCKQLGHPRTFSQCPNFYTQSEVERREAKAKENLKRREEKAKESEETLALLSNSERILKERKQAMLSQLQAEAEKVEEEFTHQIEALSRVVKKREKRGRKK